MTDNRMLPAKFRILECTLRDGSYVINFQFTSRDTELIARALDELGFPLIEVGHGIGMGASRKGLGAAAQSDAEYMQAAAKAVKNGLWGMFCIPGIATLDDLELAIDHGMGFIRVGTEVENTAQSEPFIRRAKNAGLYVCANFMKSYASQPADFAEKVVISQSFGADCVYIVDSAGGMFPDDIRRYVDATRKRSDCALGFHGHNNLGMAVANALACVDMGVEIIDTSLQGMGRSSGNTPTEQFISALTRRGYDLGYDLMGMFDLGEKQVKPLLTECGLSSIDVVSGLAQFHSSYMNVIREFSGTLGVDPRKLIIAVCAKSLTAAPRELVEAEARRLLAEGHCVDGITTRFHLNRYFGSEQK